MGKVMGWLAAGLLAAAPAVAGEGLLDRDYRVLAGKDTVNLAQAYGGRVLLVVNTASKCGFTPQYEGLEALHAKYGERGFAVLGFPSNDFMGQEPGSEEEIQEFCTLTYGVKFPMFEKVQVRGSGATPLYRDLAAATGEAPGWNFHKYLIDRSGKVVASFGSRTKPEDPKLVAEIERLLAEPAPAAR
ncbi:MULTISPECIES: glutathione peroxidase [unclassified Arenimonas]|uniref:glutathione peroxidase n=1 Tax=unclassified Arenimonas TaxID=2641713 RepID=UPI00086E059C|nr:MULTISPECIES: glutathione peroxidase [unclassified Arenimonas]ODS62394.1 MAG: glutathione peroxidase [Arenimonas sp. SCN 70-307]